MKNQIIFILLLYFPFFGISQVDNSVKEFKKNSVFIEIGGQGVVNSICFDKLIHTNKKIKNTYTTGLSFLAIKDQYWGGLTFSYNFLTGQNNNHLEFGFGLTLSSQFIRTNVTEHYNSTDSIAYKGTTLDYFLTCVPKIGYRFQKFNGGIFFRFTFTPLVSIISRYGPIRESPFPDKPTYTYFKSDANPNYPVYLWFGISIGYTFKNCR